MRIALLFVFLLNSVCGDNDVHGCVGGWVEFTCRYEKNQNLQVSAPQHSPIRGRNIVNNQWKNIDGQRSLYHNPTGKYWRVFVKKLTEKDFGEYECENDQKGEINLRGSKDCPKILKVTHIGANITINCNSPEVNFICKESSLSCDILVRGKRPVYSVINVTVQDQGEYWCGKESQKQGHKVSRQKTEVQVVEVTKRIIRTGQDLSQSCSYTNLGIKKFVCKGENTAVCQELVSTSTTPYDRFSLQDVKANSTVTLTIRNVVVEDSGSYWCGTDRTSLGKGFQFSHKLELDVVQMPLTTSPSHPDISKSTTPYIKSASVSAASPTPSQSPYDQSELQKILIFAAVICAAILLIILSVICIHKIRRGFTDTKPANKEEHCYEEIQERPLPIASGTALKTIYATASAPVASSGPDNRGKMCKTSDERFKENVLYSIDVAR